MTRSELWATRLVATAAEWRTNDPAEVRYLVDVELEVLVHDGGPRARDAAGALAYDAANADLVEGLAAWAIAAVAA